MAQAANKENLSRLLTDFINSWALYSPYVLTFADPHDEVPKLPRSILRECSTCEATPTWQQVEPRGSSSSYPHTIDVGAGFIIAYRCSHCHNQTVWLWVTAFDEWVKDANGTAVGVVSLELRKLGQIPAQGNEPPREVTKGLPATSVEMYRKGLTSLNHGFGVGALAYFRRIIEEASNGIVDMFIEHAAAADDGETVTRLKAARKSTSMEERLQLAAEALPLSLRPGGVNPLSALYIHYSRGLHRLSDAECLAIARDLVFALEYTFRNWRLQMEEAANFRKRIQKWSDPKATP